MKYRILALVSAFIISINAVCVSPLQVYASSSLFGFDDWSTGDIFYFYATHFIPIVTQCLGVVFSPSILEFDNWLLLFEQYAADDIIASGCSSYDEYIATKMHLDDAGELVLEDELVDAMYETTNVYIEQYTPYMQAYTFRTSDFINRCHTQDQYNAISDVLKNLSADEYALIRIFDKTSNYSFYDENGNLVYFPGVCIIEILQIDGFVQRSYSGEGYSTLYYEWAYAKDAEDNTKKYIYLDIDGNDITEYENYTLGDSLYSYSELGWLHSTQNVSETVSTSSSSWIFICKSGREAVRLYSTYDDYKQYSVGERSYYVTSKFQDYDVNGDNSCTISESDLTNSSIYGDVYNIIIEYDDPDGLTEEELRAILDEYIKKMQGIVDSDDSDDSGGSSGGGLFDFIDGLGSIGDALLSILGKLLEYVGKAIDLLSGTVTKIIDLIPQNITNLISGLFPFIPEEWLTAIELSLVLAVIVGVVGIFKK